MLNSRTAVWDLGEVVFAELLLFLEAERAVGGGDDLKIVLLQPLPKLFLMPPLAQGRREDVLGAFKAWRIHVFEREIKILRAGFGIDGQAAIAGFADFLQRIVAAQVNDV